ncbi:putative GATA transcription factor 22 [Magnolia sinica]|uniref:putative GATA transcription factor 22 n=1 Tax=Magnolia sinica TaxID=86752 RepID=UPI00265A363A|nr:putative GATA transcription factor 22 [Magnolia sinica]
MTPNYLNPPSPLPFVEANQSQDLLLCTPTSQTSSSSSDIFFSQTHDQKPLLHEHEADAPFSTAGTSDHHCLVSPPLPIVKDSDEYSLEPSMYKHDDRGQCDSGPIRWMSSKMRLMRKMMNSDGMVAKKHISSAHTSQNELRSPLCDGDNNNNNNSCSSYGNSSTHLIRICADCNTTKTPLWRSGPQGPKSLCNACGIRQRKARRAMAAAAAAAGNGGVMVADISSVTSKVRKEKGSDCTAQHRKRCKLVGPRTKKKLRFDDFRISLSKNSAFHQVFPQDEKEAAILLMALSCGLVNG